MTVTVYALSVLVAAALYLTGAVPVTFGVVALQVTAWVGGLTYPAIIALLRAERTS